MKKYAIYLLPVAVLTLIVSVIVSGAMLLATILTASHIAGDLPMIYLEWLSLPTLSFVVPVLGMLVLAALLPSLPTGRRLAPAKVIEPAPLKEEKSLEHLKAA